MQSLFPERMSLWKSIAETKELEVFILNNVSKFLTLYDANMKGSNKYANLYLAWLQVIRCYTCKTEQTTESIAEWGVVLAKHGTVSESIQRTVIASILNFVQDGIQAQMAGKIEQIGDSEGNPEPAESLSDDTALYRISGWALKSAIQIKRRAVTKSKGQSAKLIKEELQLLEALKLSQSSKSTLPLGAQYLDRGGLTFIHSSLLPWARALESSMKQYMTQAGYKRYGKQIFKITKGMIVLDETLFTEFHAAVQVLHPIVTVKIAKSVHEVLVTKIYHARSNEFLRTISKLACSKQKKAVDVNVGLRDSLKSLVAKKQSNI